MKKKSPNHGTADVIIVTSWHNEFLMVRERERRVKENTGILRPTKFDTISNKSKHPLR